eukprot:CAMPEP_0179933900 /NCGR_PEP_ID=MMETSP0983-20121128/12135_1 /TAXON_ID=483367 /ORGANISM="non described non described, Strain CCMP 2436" /LENGTH=39 /DNA_ID= /DNA_START= /DNA_END= /DNA_ORIENTATION=
MCILERGRGEHLPRERTQLLDQHSVCAAQIQIRRPDRPD